MKGIRDFLFESQGKNLAVTVLYVPYSLDSGGSGLGVQSVGFRELGKPRRLRPRHLPHLVQA